MLPNYLFVTSFIYCFGGWRMIQDAITIGTVTTFSLYFSTLWNSVEGFMDFFKEYRVKMISVSRLLALHQHVQQQNASLANQKELPPFETLHMENLRFSYPDSTVLKHFSLDVHQGKSF